MAKHKRRRRRGPPPARGSRNWSLMGIGTAIVLAGLAIIVGVARAT